MSAFVVAIASVAIIASQTGPLVDVHRDYVRETHLHNVRHDASHAPLLPPLPPLPPRVISGYGKWEPILQCESGGDWYINTGLYEGGLQFHPGTWDAYKPDGYPEAAYQASPEQQILVAEKVLQAQGWGAWPACSRKAGYR